MESSSHYFAEIIGPDYFSLDCFPFLELERKIRDIIYEYALVRKRIYIRSGTMPPNDEEEEEEDEYSPYYDNADSIQVSYSHHQLRKPARSRMTWLREDREGLFMETHADLESYEEGHFDFFDRPNLILFLVCRQVYQECYPLYYSKNVFDFGEPEYPFRSPSVLACLYFLKDRPLHALGHIKSIRLRIPSSGCLVRNHYCRGLIGNAMLQEQFSMLIMTVRASLNLEHLGLDLYGWPPDVRQRPWDWRDPGWYRKNRPLWWVECLLTLTDLRSLSISLIASIGDYDNPLKDEDLCPEQLLAFVRLLRSKMLKNGKALGTANIRILRRHEARRCWTLYGHLVDAWKRGTHRVFEVTCHDNEDGQSLLKLKARQPLWDKLGPKGNCFDLEHPQGDPWPDEDSTQDQRFNTCLKHRWEDMSDYDDDDDGDKDSLKSVALSDRNVGYFSDSGT